MAEPRRSTGDIPRYDTYPAPAAEEEARLAGRASLPDSRPALARKPSSRNGALSAQAENIGSTLGNAVSTVRGRVEEVAERLSHMTWNARQSAAEVAGEWKDTGQEKMRLVQRRARQWRRERPFQLIAVVAGLAFCAGVGLRIWRSSRD